jgi:hypothetical protein
MGIGAGFTVAAGHSGSWDPHASLRAIGSEQGEGDRRDACVAYVPDGRPHVRGQAGGGDVIGDAPEGRDVRATPVARDVVPQLPARLDPGERGGRRRGDVLVRPWWQGPAAACGQCRCSGRSQERSHRSILPRNGTPVLVLAHSSRVAGARSWLDAHHGWLLCHRGDHQSRPLRRHNSDLRETGTPTGVNHPTARAGSPPPSMPTSSSRSRHALLPDRPRACEAAVLPLARGRAAPPMSEFFRDEVTGCAADAGSHTNFGGPALPSGAHNVTAGGLQGVRLLSRYGIIFP